ncbi:MAG TPA: DUF3048 domain-containing protein [Candidatus Dormibacteraeota bacterium]|nr:DUF3048 domain-containing protein [Candidatus Dormibacteraeota bacterium]
MRTTPSRLNALLMLAAAFAVAACGSSPAKAPVHTPTPSATPSATPTATPTPVPSPAPVGMAAPIMIQVENLWAARPQSGLAQADVVYEYQTEGGISRFTAIFFHVPGGNVGPVRSARLVTIKLLRVYGGTLLYSGGTVYVSTLLAHSGLRQFDESQAAGTLFRVAGRDAPHNLYSDSRHLAAFEARTSHTVGYQLWARTALTSLPAGSSPLGTFQVPLSAYERPIFSYDGHSGHYTRTEPDTGVLVDANSGLPWRPSTIAILQMPITVGPEVEDPSGAHGLDFGLIGSGAGQLAMGGRLYPIRWTQGASGPPQFTLANGQPAPVAPGQMLIELVPAGQGVLAH